MNKNYIQRGIFTGEPFFFSPVSILNQLVIIITLSFLFLNITVFFFNLSSHSPFLPHEAAEEKKGERRRRQSVAEQSKIGRWRGVRDMCSRVRKRGWGLWVRRISEGFF